jgi:hypothetical protein
MCDSRRRVTDPQMSKIMARPWVDRSAAGFFGTLGTAYLPAWLALLHTLRLSLIVDLLHKKPLTASSLIYFCRSFMHGACKWRKSDYLLVANKCNVELSQANVEQVSICAKRRLQHESATYIDATFCTYPIE